MIEATQALYRPAAFWESMAAGWDVWSAAACDVEAIAARRKRRFDDLVRHARTHSAFHRELYRDLPSAGFEPRHVPPANRRELLAHFDEWVTDPEVTRRGVEAFAADPDRVGQPYLGRFAVWTSSGTTGMSGLFVHDERALAVYDALEMLRLGRGPAAPDFLQSLLLRSGCYAMVSATGGHFAGVASVERMRLLAPALADRLRIFSILDPLPRLVEALNAFAPHYLATYPTVASLLAAERKAGRLTILPATIWVGGETLTSACRAQVEDAFRCAVIQEYGASECMGIACECDCGSLHLNSDWVMLEPVDCDYRPVAPGVRSHTALLTNLANRVQPVIRYDLGDSVLVEPEACAGGSPFPALRVEGRSDEILSLRSANGEAVRLAPLALATVAENFVGAHGFQIVQTAPDALDVRLDALAGERASIWDRVRRGLCGYLLEQGLTAVKIGLDPTLPQRDARSGKLHRILALHPKR